MKEFKIDGETIEERLCGELMNRAKAFDDVRKFILNVGLEDWMFEFMQNPDAPTITEDRRIDHFLNEIFSEAHRTDGGADETNKNQQQNKRD